MLVPKGLTDLMVGVSHDFCPETLSSRRAWDTRMQSEHVVRKTG